MKRFSLFSLFALLCITSIDLGARKPYSAAPLPPVEPLIIRSMANDPHCQQWVDSVMETLSLKERVGQLFIYTISPNRQKQNVELLRKVVEDYGVGGLLFSKGQLQNQAALTNQAQQMADVPLLITFDGEWGLAMRLKETPQFPRNMVLGCIRNDSLIYEYGREMARQCHELGVQVNFAPVADVNINPLNPVINVRSFGQDPDNVARKVIAYGRGLEDGGILSVCKHFPGHGDTEIDSHHSLPTLNFSRERLDSIELYPFRQAIRAGLSGMMVGHLEVPALESQSGLPSSLSRNTVFGLLENDLQFQGLIFTDALAMKGVQNKQVENSLCLSALLAGNDLLLVPRRIKEEVQTILDAVKQGTLSTQFIDEKCRKVLTYKYALGLNKRPHIRISGLDNRINTPQTKQLITRLQQAAITVVDNRNGLLPLDPDIQELTVLHLGSAETVQPFIKQISRYTRVNTIGFPTHWSDADSLLIYKKLERTNHLIVCIDEPNQPRRSKNPQIRAKQAEMQKKVNFLNTFAPRMPIVAVSMVPQKELEALQPFLNRCDALIQAHDRASEVQTYTAELLLGKATANGRLSAAIDTLYASGTGVDLGNRSPRRYIPEDYGMSSHLLTCIDTIALEGLHADAYPSCQISVWKDGKELYNKSFSSMKAQDGSILDTKDKIYDLASLSKTTGTLLAIMKLYDKGLLNLSDELGTLLPSFQHTDKAHISVRQLLLHESGLPPTILFYKEAIDEESYPGPLFKAKPDKLHPTQIDGRTWANPNFRFRKGVTSSTRTSCHTLQVTDELWIDSTFRTDYIRQIAESKLGDKRYRYSCVGFITLQKIVESITGMSLDAYLQQEFYGPMGLTHTGYLPLRFASKDDIIPSSTDGFLRKTTLQGFVHDESAAFQGGVSGNAGLFSNANEVAAIYQMLLNEGVYNGRRYLSQATCLRFTTETSSISRRGLGFDKPDTKNLQKSPCGKGTPSSVYGHTGFTGTCAWVDPDNGLIYVFLSNRTYPKAWNPKLGRMNIRTRIQEAIYHALLKK